jgi:hypothetical protein
MALREATQRVAQGGHDRPQSIATYIRQGSVGRLLTTPIIYSLLVPFVVLDAWTTAYQWICFPVYRIPRVARSTFFVLDRHRLPYLNAIERLNCTFCSYANGVIAYVREVAARTEQYWCPIKHSRSVGTPHARYHSFVDYGDAKGYRRGLVTMRRALEPTTGTRRKDDQR